MKIARRCVQVAHWSNQVRVAVAHLESVDILIFTYTYVENSFDLVAIDRNIKCINLFQLVGSLLVKWSSSCVPKTYRCGKSSWTKIKYEFTRSLNGYS